MLERQKIEGSTEIDPPVAIHRHPKSSLTGHANAVHELSHKCFGLKFIGMHTYADTAKNLPVCLPSGPDRDPSSIQAIRADKRFVRSPTHRDTEEAHN